MYYKAFQNQSTTKIFMYYTQNAFQTQISINFEYWLKILTNIRYINPEEELKIPNITLPEIYRTQNSNLKFEEPCATNTAIKHVQQCDIQYENNETFMTERQSTSCNNKRMNNSQKRGVRTNCRARRTTIQYVLQTSIALIK